MKASSKSSPAKAILPLAIAAALVFQTLTFGVHSEEHGGTPIAVVPPMEGRPGYVMIAASGPDGEFLAEWGGYGENEPGAESDWDGLANTQALLASQHTHPIVQAVTAYRGGGFDDWYLMAKRESALAYAMAPAGLFTRALHWTSTQYAGYPGYAWLQVFNNGSQDGWGKDDPCRARAVRRLVIQ